MKARGGYAGRHSVNLRLPPRDGKSQRCVEQGVEIIGVPGEFPKVVSVDLDEFLDCLLKTHIELVSVAWPQSSAAAAGSSGGEPTGSRRARQNQVFVVWGFKRARVRGPEHCSRAFEQIRGADAGL